MIPASSRKIVVMEKTLVQRMQIETLLKPENELEAEILRQPEFLRGLMWGKPRYGHPEGKVLYHIREVLNNVDKLSLLPKERKDLRLVTFIHDTFKHLEDKDSYPRDWSKHHGVYARKFAEKFIDDPALLQLIEMHDEAYYSWRLTHQYSKIEEGQQRLQRLLEQINGSLQLYYLFFKCDTRTGDKNQAPLKWFEKTISGIEIVDF